MESGQGVLSTGSVPGLCPYLSPVLKERGKSFENVQFCTHDNSVTEADFFLLLSLHNTVA